MTWLFSTFPMLFHLVIQPTISDMLINFIIIALIVLLSLVLARRYELPIKAQWGHKISELRRVYNHFCWLLLVSAGYLLLKVFIYSAIFTSVPATITHIEAKAFSATLFSQARPSVSRNVSGVKYYPTIEVTVKNKQQSFSLEENFSKESFQVGDKVTLTYINVWGELSYENYGGIYFFRHDSIIFIIIFAWLGMIKLYKGHQEDLFDDQMLQGKSPANVFYGLMAIFIGLMFIRLIGALFIVAIRTFGNIFFPSI
jgi:hypothetical protein